MSSAQEEMPHNPTTFLDRLFAASQSYLEDDRFATIGGSDQFFTKVVGVTFEGRQDVVGGIVEGSPIALQREPQNPYDPNAVAVFTGQLQLGYLRRQIARRIAPNMDAGQVYTASVGSLTGGGTQSFGLNISVARENAKAASKDRPEPETTQHSVLTALLGDRDLHESQRAVLDRLDAGKNTLAVLGTGRGKSLCFQYPAAVRALEDGHKTVVIYPLRALANDQYEALEGRLGPLGLRIFKANGSIDMDARTDLMRALATGEWDIICSTPEFFIYHIDKFKTLSRPHLVVVDESHHLFQSKHRKAYGHIQSALQILDRPQVLALTATADEEVFEHIVKTLDIEAWVIDPTIRVNLKMIDARRTVNKFKYLQDHLGGEAGKAIIYCMSRSESTKVAERLRATVPNIAFYHAGVPTEERTEIERMFRAGELRVVVATSAFGEGIDLPDIRDVFLYHMNFDFTEFNQQSGRAGRDGKTAQIHMLFGEKDRRINDFIIAKVAPTVHTLRKIYCELKKLGSEIRQTYIDLVALLQIDSVDAGTVSAAAHIFADTGLAELGADDDGRFLRFRTIKEGDSIDLSTSARYAEGEAERESFGAFCEIVLNTPPELLENLINRPIYPTNIPLLTE